MGRSFFFNKVADFRPATLFKNDFDAVVCLGISRNSLERVIYGTPVSGCFGNLRLSYIEPGNVYYSVLLDGLLSRSILKTLSLLKQTHKQKSQKFKLSLRTKFV